MERLITEVQSTLVEIVGQAIALLPALLGGLIILALTYYAANLARHLTDQMASRLIQNRSLRSLAVQIGYAIAWVIGILLAAVIAFPDLGLGDIVALLGLGSVAVGFAFQDIFKNFLAGIILLVQQPFQIGDQIVVEDYEGTVETIALRSTQIRTYRGEAIVIPNSIVFTSAVHVMTDLPQRRTDLAIGVDYNTPLPVAVKTLLRAANQVDGVRTDPAVEVDITGFGDSSIDLVVRYWTDPHQAQVRRIKTQMMIALKQACDDADINIPYPIRTVYFFDQENYSDRYPTDGQTPVVSSQASSQVSSQTHE